MTDPPPAAGSSWVPTAARNLRFRPGHAARPFGPLVVLIVLLCGLGAVEPSFLSLYSLNVLADESSVILILAAAQTIIVLLGGIDLSMTAVASLSSVLIALALPSSGPAGIPVVLALTTAIGAIQGLIQTRGQIPSFIVTLGGMGVWSGLALTIAHSTIPVTAVYSTLDWLAHSTMGVPNSFNLALAAVMVLGGALRWLPFGRYIYAIGLGERVAILSGVRAGQVKVLAFALTGLFSGLAGLVMVARNSSGSPTIADSLLLPSVASVVIGGTLITGGEGGLWRTLIGVLTVTVLRLGLATLGLNPAYEPIAYGLLAIAAVALTIDHSRADIVK